MINETAMENYIILELLIDLCKNKKMKDFDSLTI